jgi:hypothetical protein
LTIVRAIGGKFPRFLRLFFYILVSGINVTKTGKKCTQFVYIFADLLLVKCQTKFLMLAVKCLTNYLLSQTIFLKIVWQEFKLSKGFLKHIVYTIGWRNTPVLSNNFLTRIQTFHRLFEANCLYNRMEKHACFAEQLFDKSLTRLIAKNQSEVHMF